MRADGGPEPVPYGEPDAEPTSTPDPMTAGGNVSRSNGSVNASVARAGQA